MDTRTHTPLDELPPNTDLDFWSLAEVNGGLKPQRLFDDNHFFVRVDGRNAQCSHCTWGFALDPGDKIIDGHLFDKEGVKVI